MLEFTKLLRQSGIKNSLSETMDCLKALDLVGLQREQFYQALRCTLIKDQADEGIFDKLFHLYFDIVLSRGKPDPELESPGTGASVTAQMVEAVTGEGLGWGASGSPYMLLMKAIMENIGDLQSRLIEMAVDSLGPMQCGFLKEIDETVKKAKVFIGWFEAVFHLDLKRERGEVDEKTYNTWQERLQSMHRRLVTRVEEELSRAFGLEALEDILENTNLKEIAFFKLNNDQVEEIRRRITKLARKLATRYSRRYRPAKKGRIDLRRTIRRAVNTGGVAIFLARKCREARKPELVLLCDVSGSVALFSEFMLQLVYTLQNRFRWVRSFLFVDTIDDVTDYFRNREVEEAINEAFSRAKFSVSGFSDFGKVFVEFETRFLTAVSERSTVIVLGDARSNWRLPEVDAFRRIAGRARQVIWLNPQTESSWNTEDSVMNVYQPFCRHVFECRNYNQLEIVAREIFQAAR